MAITKLENPIRSLSEVLMEGVEQYYQEESKRIAEKHKEQFAKEMDELANELVLKAGFSIRQQVSIHDFGEVIQITYVKDAK